MDAMASPVVTCEPMLGTSTGMRHRLALRVDATFTEAFDGRLQIVQDSPTSVVYSRTLKVGAGTFRWEINPQLAPSPDASTFVTMRLMDSRGRLQAEQRIDVQIDRFGQGFGNTSENAKIGILGDVPVLKKILTRFSRIKDETLYPRLLPSDWRFMDNLDALLITGKGAEALDEEQVAMLTTWMNAGGVVLLDGSLQPSAAASAISREWGLGPIPEPRQVEQRFDIPSIANAYDYLGANEGAEKETFKGMVEMRALRRGNLVADQSYIQRGLHTPFGLGTLILLPANLSSLAAQSSDAAGVILMQGLNVSGQAREFEDGQGYSYWSYQRGGWGTFMQAFSKLAPISIPAIIIYVFLFLFVVGPAEFILLRVIKKPHWTWLVTPLLVVAFCIGADILSVMTRGVKPYRGLVSVSDYAPGVGRDYVYECLISPRSDTKEVTLPADAQLQNHHFYGTSSRLFERRGESAFTMDMRAWIPVTYSVNAPHSRPAPYKVSISKEGRNLSVVCDTTDQAPPIRRAQLWLSRKRFCELKQSDNTDTWVFQGRPEKIEAKNVNDLNDLLLMFHRRDLVFREHENVSKRMEDILSWKSSHNGFSLLGKIYFDPLFIPMPVVNDEQALLVVFVDEPGADSGVAWDKDSHLQYMHVARQLVPLSSGETP
jgi:hypothetical protein